MATAAYLTECRSVFDTLVSTKTRQQLSNQRKGEVGETVTGVVDAVIDKAIELAAGQIEDELGEGATTDAAHIKYTVTLAIHDLAVTYSLNISDIAIVSRDQLDKQVARAKKSRRAAKDRLGSGEKSTGWTAPPSGHDPFSNIGS